MGCTMSDNICPNCKSEINAGDNFCKSCGFSLNNQKTNGQLAFMISIDAASEHTYTKLRPGGNFNKLLDKVSIDKLKEDLIEFGIINPKSDSEVKTTVIIDDEEPEEPVEEEVSQEEPQNNETPEPPRDESPKINVCSKCGFENRSKVKFCTNCGNKL